MQLVVNDLSVKFPCQSEQQAQEIMKEFIEIYSCVKDVLEDDRVFLDKDYRSYELAQNYRFEQWLNDKRIDIELKRKFRTIMNRSYTFDSEVFEKEHHWKMDAEFLHEELVSRSCQLVYEIEGILISFLTNAYWKNASIGGVYTYLDETGEIISESAEIPNVSCKENVMDFRKRQESILALQERKKIHSGMDIFLGKDEMFPNLIFCDNVIKQLKTEIGGAEAGQVYRRLKELQVVAEEMKDKFEFEKLTHATPETELTLQMFADEHRIQLPNGMRQIFSWHVRFTGAYAGRIFFEPVPKERKVYIGHIGRKLPTAKYH